MSTKKAAEDSDDPGSKLMASLRQYLERVAQVRNLHNHYEAQLSRMMRGEPPEADWKQIEKLKLERISDSHTDWEEVLQCGTVAAAWLESMGIPCDKILHIKEHFSASVLLGTGSPGFLNVFVQDLSNHIQALKLQLERAQIVAANRLPLPSAEQAQKGGDSQKIDKRRKPPSQKAIFAYRILMATNGKQECIAKIMSEQLGKNISQGNVSRWIKRAEEWLRDGNVLPEMPEPATRPKTIDPERLDIGPRTDGFTARQQHRRSIED
jgi:hypothetical protein